MDPITAAGVALSVAGIAGQVFTGCIQCIQLVITARDLPRDCGYLVLRLRMEQQRLFAWSEASGLLDFDSTKGDKSKLLEANVFGLHRSTLLDLLVQIKVLFEDFEKQQRRNNRLDIRKDGDEQATDTDPIHNAKHDDLVPLTSKRRAFIEKTMKSLSDVSKETVTRLRWVAFDKSAFEILLQRFSSLNDNMTGLLDMRLQNEIYNTTQDTNRGVLQLAHDLADLQQLVKATLVFHIQNQSSFAAATPPPPYSAGEKDSGLQLLAQLARFKAFNQSVEMGPVDNSSFQELELSADHDATIELDKSTIEVVETLESSNEADTTRCEALLTKSDGSKQHIWIEWKEYDWQPDGSPPVSPLILDRVRKLVQLLHHRSRPEYFRVPHCIGYFDNARHDDEDGDDDLKIGFVFEKPSGVDPDIPPISLLGLLRSHRKPSVTDRIALAQAIATCILYLHSVNWLHKGLRSHNIVFFKERNTTTGVEKINYNKPYISGFDFARPARPEEQTEAPGDNLEYDIYRHPSTQSCCLGPRAAYRKSFDIYSLGVILVELAFWKSVDQILNIDIWNSKTKARSASRVRSSLLEQDVMDELGASMGVVYGEVTRRCLAGGDELGISNKGDETDDYVAATLSRVFHDSVVKRLEDIRI